MESKGTVALIRKTRIGWLRSLRIFLDGQKFESVDEDATVEMEVSPGPHELYVKMDWWRSPKFHFNISAGERIHLVTRSFRKGWGSYLTILYLFILFNKAFSIERVTPTQFAEWSKVNYPPGRKKFELTLFFVFLGIGLGLSFLSFFIR